MQITCARFLNVYIFFDFTNTIFMFHFLEMVSLIYTILLVFLIAVVSSSPIALGEWADEIEYYSTTFATTTSFSSSTSSLSTSSSLVLQYEEVSSSASAIYLEIKPSSDGWIIAFKYGGIGGGSGKII